MTVSQKLREQMLKLCGSLSSEDGIDPNKFHESKRPRAQRDLHRQLRLCRQVGQVLDLVLSESASHAVRSLRVDQVIPGKSAASLIVRIVSTDEDRARSHAEWQRLLREEEGWLRSEVAATITRKFVPKFVFEFSSAESLTDGVNDGR